MKHQSTKILFVLFMSMVGVKAFTQDFSVANSDGISIFYNYINDGKELEVTKGRNHTYSGDVVIPEEVTYMNRTRKVTSIRANAFFNSLFLISVTIPKSVTTIGNAAFSFCPKMTSVTIPNSVTIIGERAFEGCSSLNSITVPTGVTNIGESTFYQCKSLTFLIIPNNVTNIGVSAFEGCSSLTSVTIPNSVTNIGERAFEGCSSLNSITIPNSVTSIGERTFAEIDLQTIFSYIENPYRIYGKVTSQGTFNLNTFNNATLYVPKGTIDKYKATEGWKDFIFIEESSSTNINSVKEVQITEAERYTIDGKRISKPRRGLNIIKMTDGTIKKCIAK